MKIFKLSENYILDVSELLYASVKDENIILVFKNDDTDLVAFDSNDDAKEMFNLLYDCCKG